MSDENAENTDTSAGGDPLANIPESEPMPVSGWVSPMTGWRNYMAETGFNSGNVPATAVLTRQMWDQLWDALSEACTTPYHSDLGGDLWRSDWEGDCEDKSLAMRDRLIAEGWPKGALRLVLCKTEAGEDHCVLSAVTDRGVYVLDERARGVVSWRGLPYAWIAREHPGYSLWEKIAAAPETPDTPDSGGA